MRSLGKTAAVLFLLVFIQKANAFSVLTHEMIIDANWEKGIKPLLLKKYPDTEEEDFRIAKAYAYGGAIVPDLGYYPFGSKFFTELVHYVRSGDMIESLIHEAKDANELSFALGFLSHYYADNLGHSLCTNISSPLIYPKLQKKFGDEVTYYDDHISHIRTEFGFDVLVVARTGYVSENYHNFIGFEVALDLLARSFEKTYHLELKEIFFNLPIAIRSFRLSVKKLFPSLTKAAYLTKKDELRKENPVIRKKQYIYKMSAATYRKEWDGRDKGAGFEVQMLRVVIHLLPKVGPFRPLRFKIPTPESEKLFNKSLEVINKNYAATLAKIGEKQVFISNKNFDTGVLSHWGKYPLADEAYRHLLKEISGKDSIPLDLVSNILSFYDSSRLEIKTKKKSREWKKVSADLSGLKN